MPFTRRRFAGLVLAAAAVPEAVRAQEDGLLVAQRSALFGTSTEFRDGMARIRDRGDPDMAAGLILMLPFARARRDKIGETLAAITGADHGADWFNWMLWQERNPQVVPHESYATLLRDLYLRVDPNFDPFLRLEYLDRAKARIRIEEITWGGVVKDGIPSLDGPDLIAASEAEYLRGDDLVFGVSINGDVRAYPLRIMGWHEMFNEVIGGVPVALAYCTLCGSGILFETQLAGRSAPMVFGSSGFLYRSNKLMFDRGTHTLWNQFTGEPVVGPLADSGIKLRQRPVVITTWDSWRRSNPGTRVLSLNTGHRRDYGSGVVYQDYFASTDLMFPALVDQRRHRQKDYVFAIREFGAARAWPLEAFARRSVINDAIADTPLVLIGDADKRSVRAYERGPRTFSATVAGLQDEAGATWQVTEDALIGPDGTRLERVAGHISYWFAFDNYMGEVGTVFDG